MVSDADIRASIDNLSGEPVEDFNAIKELILRTKADSLMFAAGILKTLSDSFEDMGDVDDKTIRTYRHLSSMFSDLASVEKRKF